MADDVKMVVVDGVRYRPDEAPKKADVKVEADGDGETVEHKMRTPRKATARRSSKSE